MDFVSAKYVKPAGGPGRVAAPNPYIDVVAEIALKRDKDGDPEARAFTVAYGPNTDEGKAEFAKTIARIKRQLSDAGAGNTPPVTVPVNVGKAQKKQGAVTVEDKANALVTFWTVKRQSRPRKPKTDDATK